MEIVMIDYSPSVRIIIEVLKETQPTTRRKLQCDCEKEGLCLDSIQSFREALKWMDNRNMIAYQNCDYLRLADFYGELAEEHEKNGNSHE